MLKILLTEDVEHLGSLGDEVKVKPGFARNFLIPKGKAVPITSQNAKRISLHKKKLDEVRQKAIQTSKDLAQKIEELELLFVMKSAEGGKLFGAVNTRQILDELEKNGVVLDSRHALSSEHIKQVGSYVIPVKLHSTVRANLRLRIETERVQPEKEVTPIKAEEPDSKNALKEKKSTKASTKKKKNPLRHDSISLFALALVSEKAGQDAKRVFGV